MPLIFFMMFEQLKVVKTEWAASKSNGFSVTRGIQAEDDGHLEEMYGIYALEKECAKTKVSPGPFQLCVLWDSTYMDFVKCAFIRQVFSSSKTQLIRW